MANPQNKPDPLLEAQLEAEQLREEKAQLAARLADLEGRDIDSDPRQALTDLIKSITGAVPAKKGDNVRKVHEPYVLTEARKAEIEKLLEQFKDKGLEYKFGDQSLTLRKKIKVRRWDEEAKAHVIEEAYKSESVHCSSLDRIIVRVARLLVLI
jgi:hypothetical protein